MLLCNSFWLQALEKLAIQNPTYSNKNFKIAEQQKSANKVSLLYCTGWTDSYHPHHSYKNILISLHN